MHNLHVGVYTRFGKIVVIDCIYLSFCSQNTNLHYGLISNLNLHLHITDLLGALFQIDMIWRNRRKTETETEIEMQSSTGNDKAAILEQIQSSQCPLSFADTNLQKASVSLLEIKNII